jgi:hypothetical protein
LAVAEVALNWAEATVEDGKLTAPLDGEIPDGWGDHFGRTVKLLRSEWDAVAVKDQSVRVANVSSGDEGKVRFYLEGVVDQANSAHAAEQEDGQEEESREARGPEGEDAEMTERFRAFAQDDEEDGAR